MLEFKQFSSTFDFQKNYYIALNFFVFITKFNLNLVCNF